MSDRNFENRNTHLLGWKPAVGVIEGARRVRKALDRREIPAQSDVARSSEVAANDSATPDMIEPLHTVAMSN
jgi:hypothetical protein